MDLYSIIHLVVGNIAIVILILLSLAVLSKYRKDKIPATLIFSLFFISILIWAICSTYYPFTTAQRLAVILYCIGVFFSYLGFFNLFLFSNLVKSGSINLKLGVYFSFLLGTILMLLITGENIFYEMIFYSNFGYYAKALLFFLIIQFAFILPVGILFIDACFQMVRKSKTKKHKTQTRLTFLGSLIGIPGAIIALAIVEIIFIPSLVLLVSALGLLIFALGYLQNTQLAYLVPYQCYRIIVIKKSGITCYAKNFEGEQKINDNLISGAISAISSIMESALGFKSELKVIKLLNAVMILDLREGFSGILISNKFSTVLKNALTSFLNQFQEKFYPLVKTSDMCLDEKTEQKVDNLTRNIFSFLP
ncbi:MAG: hypothetical protein GF383_03925 [Candidatus Lokiarchaeota archaeon]|nr:hypothetical protein [Candidatus Lokiarchaeota archaeon]MBD3338873.1 hypothetical protein [Candidatus Lokiarchaeota archaeon]